LPVSNATSNTEVDHPHAALTLLEALRERQVAERRDSLICESPTKAVRPTSVIPRVNPGNSMIVSV
jgi:hypothetical protein